MKKIISSIFLLMVSVIFVHAEEFPVDGAVYRLTNTVKNNAVLVEDYLTNNLDGGAKSSLCNDLWRFTKNGDGWSVQNVLTDRYVQNEIGYNVLFRTDVIPAQFFVSQNTKFTPKCYNILNGTNKNYGIHCASGNKIVPWYPATSSFEGTEWTYERVDVSDEVIAAARERLEDLVYVYNNQEHVSEIFLSHFTDETCTILKSEYQAMSDEELAASMDSCGGELIAVALKIKNNTWAEREKEYRVSTYAPYSDPDYWGDKLITFSYSWLSNPTGICGTGGDVLYVFVGEEPKKGSTLEIDAVIDNNSRGTRTTLKKGMNIIPVVGKDPTYFIIYTADTKRDYVLSDFDSIPIHIEGGYVNGYWDKQRHTDADWVDLTRNHAKHKYMFVKGDNIMYFMNRELMISSNICPNTISDAIGWWDNMVMWQQEIMGLEDVRPSRFNNRLCAISYAGDGLMSATNHVTSYVETCLFEVLPFNKVMEKSGFCWGPSHEVGHVHQKAINMIGCTEASNNLFSNISIYKLGKFVTSGDAVITNMAKYYGEKTPWTLQDIGAKMRMYFQLYLYYHVAGNDTLFYPKLYKLLREDPMKKTAGSSSINYGRNDLLHFAKKCCEAAGEDLTNFFEAWGFFQIMSKDMIGDYGDYYISSTKTMITDAKKTMAKYPKKAAAIEFIEDRAAPSLRTDGGEGYKLDYVAGKYAEMGQYTAYYPDSLNVTASGYIYTKSGNKLTFSEGKNAVGFKIYDSDSTLLTFTNFHQIELSDEIASKDIIIVAVSANGTEVTVNDKKNGTEEQQLEALNEALAAAEVILSHKDNGNKYVGYFYESVIDEFTPMVDSIKAIIENKDQSVHTYGQWADILDKKVTYLLADKNSRVQIQSGNSYQLTNVNYSKMSMYCESNRITCKSGNTTPKARRFTFLTTGKENEFYISNNSRYIDYIARSRQATTNTTKKADALKFTVGEHGFAQFYVYKTGDTGLGLHCDSYNNVVGWNHTDDPSLWTLQCVDLKKEKADEKSLQALVSEAVSIYDLIVDTTNTESITLYDWVIVSSETLLTDIQTMMAKVALSESAINSKYYEKYPALIDELTSLIASVTAGYSVPTGINGVIIDDQNTVIYDSRGRKVNVITSPGVYIVNGKKMYINSITK